MSERKSPLWATIETEVKPGEWLYERPIGTLSSGESGQETRIGVVQRGEQEPCIKVGDVWLTVQESELLITMVQSARKTQAPKGSLVRMSG